MRKNVLIISSTPRKGGNSDILCDAFADGTREAGHKVEKVRIADLKIGYCTGCYACQKTGTCAIKDDARKVIDKMMAADVIVLASPVYFYSISAQLKALYGEGVLWVRPAKMFFETIERDGKAMKRFELLEDAK